MAGMWCAAGSNSGSVVVCGTGGAAWRMHNTPYQYVQGINVVVGSAGGARAAARLPWLPPTKAGKGLQP